MIDLDDTIVALASAPGPAARCVVRVAGQGAAAATRAVFRPADERRWDDARLPMAHDGALALPDFDVPVSAAVWWWPTGRSYCGQPTAEVHLVGSMPVVDALVERLCGCGARPARRGEFTLRAVLAGRLDLVQAEAVLGVIDAEDSEDLRAALAQLSGGLSGGLTGLHEQLMNDLADLEAGLDFVEEDIEFIGRDEFRGRLAAAAEEVVRLHADAERATPAAGVPRVVLTGRPNAGKSTLLNALAGREAALVSDVAGTTRDYVSARGEVEGRAVEWVDTAGSDDGADPLVRSAERVRAEQVDAADLVLFCTRADAGEWSADRADVARLRDSGRRVLHVVTQSDRGGGWIADEEDHQKEAALGECDDAGLAPLAVVVSAVTGGGLSELVSAVAAQIDRSDRGELLATTAARCRESLADAADALAAATGLADSGAGDELIAAELRRALDELGRILGRVIDEDILDRLFARFCVGK